jgi:HrpA-like RNA helicase
MESAFHFIHDVWTCMKILTEGSEVPNPVFVVKVHCISQCLRSGTANFISWLTGERSTWEEDKSDIDPNCATAFVYNPHISLSFEQQRESLPVFKNRNHILYLLEKFQTLVLVGETGCGKSTQVPQVRH